MTIKTGRDDNITAGMTAFDSRHPGKGEALIRDLPINSSLPLYQTVSEIPAQGRDD